jgi:hypothetical protein
MIEERYSLVQETVDTETGDVQRRNTAEFSADTLTEVLENFTYFLNGVSYTYVEDLVPIKTSSLVKENEQPSAGYYDF